MTPLMRDSLALRHLGGLENAGPGRRKASQSREGTDYATTYFT